MIRATDKRSIGVDMKSNSNKPLIRRDGSRSGRGFESTGTRRPEPLTDDDRNPHVLSWKEIATEFIRFNRKPRLRSARDGLELKTEGERGYQSAVPLTPPTHTGAISHCNRFVCERDKATFMATTLCRAAHAHRTK